MQENDMKAQIIDALEGVTVNSDLPAFERVILDWGTINSVATTYSYKISLLTLLAIILLFKAAPDIASSYSKSIVIVFWGNLSLLLASIIHVLFCPETIKRFPSRVDLKVYLIKVGVESKKLMMNDLSSLIWKNQNESNKAIRFIITSLFYTYGIYLVAQLKNPLGAIIEATFQ